MISVGEAFRYVIEGMPEPVTETMAVENCHGRILAAEVISDISMPPFNRSAMDGYALRGISESYELLPEIPAGSDPPPMEKDGYAAPIMTGAPVPEGADRVVMVEVTETSGSRVRVKTMPGPGENICFEAEDIEAGQAVLHRGALLTPSEIGIASMAGRSCLKVFKRPSVSIITTGTEVISPACVPGPGEVRNANGALMASPLSMNGFSPAAVFHSDDDPASLRNIVVQAAEVSDMIITAGGISMGTRDYIPEVFTNLGYSFRFRSVAQKPGKPFSFAIGNRLMFGLPGNPVSVLVALEMYVLPALRHASGHGSYRRKVLSGSMKTPLRKKQGRQYFYRCMATRHGGSWSLSVPETSGSGDLMSAGGTNSIAWLPPDSSGAEVGDTVPFSLMSWAGGESIWE